MNSRDLNERIKNLVNHFSPQLENLENRSTVRVGGVIVNILDPRDFVDIPEEKYEGKMTEVQDYPVQVVLDDSLGEVPIFVFRKIYDVYKEHIDVGNVVLVDGGIHETSNPEDGEKKYVLAYSFRQINGQEKDGDEQE